MRPLLALALLWPLTARAAMGPEDFIRQADGLAMAAIEAGRMAQGSDTAPGPVRALGRQLGADAAVTRQHLQAQAAAHEAAPAAQLEPQQRAALERLSHLRGQAFAQAYLDHAIDLLEQSRAVFDVAEAEDDPALRQLARAELPLLDQRLRVAHTLYDSMMAGD